MAISETWREQIEKFSYMPRVLSPVMPLDADLRINDPRRYYETRLPEPHDKERVLRWGLDKMVNKYRSAFRRDHKPLVFESLTDKDKRQILDSRMATAASNTMTELFDRRTIDARHLWEISHHAFYHDRRIEDWIWTLAFNATEDFSDEKRWLNYPLALFGRWHDFMQVQYTRESLANGGMTDSRLGHTTGGALLILCFEDKFSRVTGIPGRRDMKEGKDIAKRIISAASVATLMHGLDNTDKLLANLSNGSGIDPARLTDTEVLLKAFEAGELDPGKLRRKDIVSLHKAKRKGQRDFNSFGLTTEIEGVFADELRGLENDESLLFDDISDSMRHDIRLVCDIGYIADQIDMVYPPRYAMMRKLLGPVSQGRPVFRGTSDENISKFSQFFQGLNEKDSEYFLHKHSDINRSLVEFVQLIDLLENSPLMSQNKRAKEIIYSIFQSGLSSVDDIGYRLIINDESLFDEIYKGLMDELTAKYVRRKPGVDTGFNLLLGVDINDLESAYIEIISNLQMEYNALRSRMYGKGTMEASQRSGLAREFNEFMPRFALLAQDYLSKKYKELVDLGIKRDSETDTWLPYTTYYSLADIRQMQRLLWR